jgi:hypothetical protein
MKTHVKVVHHNHNKTNENKKSNHTPNLLSKTQMHVVLPDPSQALDERLWFHPIGTPPKDQDIFWAKSQPSAPPRRLLVPVST